MRGFTGFSESSDPEDVIALLREYHAAIGRIIVKYSGTLERFAVPIAPESRKQRVHFGLGQVFTHTIGCVWFAHCGHWSQNSAFDQLARV